MPGFGFSLDVAPKKEKNAKTLLVYPWRVALAPGSTALSVRTTLQTSKYKQANTAPVSSSTWTVAPQQLSGNQHPLSKHLLLFTTLGFVESTASPLPAGTGKYCTCSAGSSGLQRHQNCGCSYVGSKYLPNQTIFS